MVVKELVDDVHKNLTGLLERAKTERENPYIVSILENLVSLTDTSEPGSTTTEDQQKAIEAQREINAQVPPEVISPAIPTLNFSARMEQQQERERQAAEYKDGNTTE